MILSIEDKFEKATTLAEKIRGEFVISQKYKDEREWWILGHLIKLLKESNNPYPVYAKKTKPNDPDFITFDFKKKQFKPIEILEVLTPNRKRGKEYLESEKITEPYIEEIKKVKNPWSSFVKKLNDKFLKIYQKDCWLIVYHNMNYGEISNYGFWHNTLLANVEEWRKKNFVNFSMCPYEKIYVLNSNVKAMVCIYPELKILVPEKSAGGLTINLY